MKLTFKDLLRVNQLGALVDIPEGKHIGWDEQGKLQLMDDPKPKDVTERIKTFDDALNELAEREAHGETEAHMILENYESVKQVQEEDTDLMTYMQLRIITCAINEGWIPQFTEDERRWYPYFYLWTEDELKDKSDEWKDDHKLLRWGGSAASGSSCGVACSSSNADWSIAYADIGSRLAYKTKALATYAGRTFVPVYARFFLGDKAEGLKPWREVEGKQEPADEEE